MLGKLPKRKKFHGNNALGQAFAPRVRAKLIAMSTLDDGDYDCVVVDVARDNDDVVVIELAIAVGASKGHTVRLRSAMRDEPLEWLGLPGTLHVADGVPKFRLEST